MLPRSSLRRALLAALRQARKARRPRARGTDRRGQIPNMTPIAARQAEVATRTVPGHWEGDLIKGTRNGSAVGTLAERLAIRIFCADPYRPWQRGTNENTNGWLRPYRPKGTDLSGYTQREMNALAHRLNTRPRKCLDVATEIKSNLVYGRSVV